MDKAGLARWRRAMQEEREAKKTEEAKRLRDVPPETTVLQTFELMVFMRRLSEAADRQSAPKK